METNESIKKVDYKKILLILAFTVAWGLFAHGIMLSNKISFHDDMGNVGLGATYGSGRWMLEVILRFQNKISGYVNFSLPWYNGILSLFFIGLAAYLIIDVLRISNKLGWFSIAGIMATFPTVTGLFGYMFTAPTYMFGMFLAVLGAYTICKNMKFINVVIGALFIACSIGVYQAYMPLAVCIFVMHFFLSVWNDEIIDWKNYFKNCIYYVFTCALFMAMYFGLNKFFLVYFGGQLSNYQGIGTFGATGIRGYLIRILTAYIEFFNPTDGVSRNMYPFTMRVSYKLMIMAILVILLVLLVKVLKTNINKFFKLVPLIIVFPLASNLIYVMCDVNAEPGIHSLMMYAQVSPFILFALLNEKFIMENIEYKYSRIKKIVAYGALASVILFSIFYARLANICYLKADYLQTEAISYFNTLIARIESVEGYNPDYPLMYINEFEKKGPIVPSYFDGVNIIPYNTNDITNTHTWKVFMSIWCGYSPSYDYDESIIQSQEAIEMPSYPANGSIKVINGIVVVKF